MIAIWFLSISGVLLYWLLKPASVKLYEGRETAVSAWKQAVRISSEQQLYSTRFLTSGDWGARFDDLTKSVSGVANSRE